MGSEWQIIQIVSAFLLPPLSFLLPGVAGVLLWKRRPALGRGLAAFSLALLWVFSLPVTGQALLGLLERGSDGPVGTRTPAQAIVVLGGGTRFGAPEYGGGDAPSMATLERLRYAALLHRRTALPVLVTGGDPAGRGVAEAELMQQILEQEFGVPVRWVEAASNDTLQNAAYSRRLLEEAGVQTILLVTQAWHMPRARLLFERAGFTVVPAGTGGERPTGSQVTDFLPRADGLQDSRWFFHEVIGLLWARMHD